jgi:hypothetical protein
MKSFLLSIFLLFTSLCAFSQTFSDGKILRPGHFSVGLNPVLEQTLPGIYVRGGYGINRHLNLNAKFGAFEGKDYAGADLEWIVKSNRKMDISCRVGAHAISDLGLDAGLAAGFTLNTHATFFSGLDLDFNFNMNHDRFFWVPLGLKFFISPSLRLILEADIPVVEFAPSIFGGGLVFNFK